jgi:DNA-binding transcriptional LysR family regulator
MDTSSLEIFVEVVRRGSFAAVARDRELDPSAVSRTIRSLETELGGRLFQRTTRRLALTEAGAVFFDRIVPVVDDLARARVSVAEMNGRPAGTLRVTTSVSLGERCLVPMLPRFMELYPELAIDLNLNDTMIDIVAERYDMAIRLGRLADSALVASRLAPTRYVVAASPGYLAVHEPITSPGDLRRHSCLLFPYAGFRSRWVFRDRSGELSEVPVRGRTMISSAIGLEHCALAGMGVTLLAEWLIGEHLRAGRLVKLFDDHDVTPAPANFDTAIWFVYPSRAQMPLKVRVFSDFVRDAFRIKAAAMA